LAYSNLFCLGKANKTNKTAMRNFGQFHMAVDGTSGQKTGKSRITFPAVHKLAASQRTAVAGLDISPPFWNSRVVTGRTTS